MWLLVGHLTLLILWVLVELRQRVNNIKDLANSSDENQDRSWEENQQQKVQQI